MSRKQGKERGNRREASEDERLEHLALGSLENLFERRILVHEFLRRAEDMDGVVDTDAQNDGGDKHGERVELAVDKRGKRERGDTGVKHGRRHENRALHAPEEYHREEDDKHEAYAEREDGIVCDVIHFLEALVRAFHGEARGHGVSLAAEIREQGIGTRKDMRHELVIGRRLDELRVHHAVEQDLAGAVGLRATDEAGTQFRRDRLLLVPFAGIVLLGSVFLLVLLEESIERAGGFVGESKFLRDIGTEPHTLLLGRSRRGFTRVACGICRRFIAQQVDDKRAVLAPDFQLQVF